MEALQLAWCYHCSRDGPSNKKIFPFRGQMSLPGVMTSIWLVLCSALQLDTFSIQSLEGGLRSSCEVIHTGQTYTIASPGKCANSGHQSEAICFLSVLEMPHFQFCCRRHLPHLCAGRTAWPWRSSHQATGSSFLKNAFGLNLGVWSRRIS